MDAHDQAQPPASQLLQSNTVPIAQLAPTLEGLSETSIRGVVALLWPFSSSTRSISLLLAEPDFRLRRSGGQVRVVFHGPVAEEVAKTQVGIGDSVYLSLAGSRLEENDPNVLTPGKSVAWDVYFESTVLVEVWRSDKHLSTVKIDPPTSPRRSAEKTTPTPTTPEPTGVAHLRGLDSATWKSPAFLGSSRTYVGDHVAGSTLNPALDSFAEEDGFIPGKGRKRPRFSMRNDWRLVDEPASPEDLEIPGDWTAMFDDEAWLNEAAAEFEEAAPETNVSPQDSTKPASPQSNKTNTLSPAPPDEQESASAITGAEQTPDAHGTHGDDFPEKSEPKSDAQFLRPQRFQPQEFSRYMHQTISGLAGHLPTDTPRLDPIPSPGLPIPSPLISSSNSPHGYFESVSVTSEPAQLTAPGSDFTPELSQVASGVGRGTELDSMDGQAQEPSEGSPGIVIDAVSNEIDEPSPASESLEEDLDHSTFRETVMEEDSESSFIAASRERESDVEMRDEEPRRSEQRETEGSQETPESEKEASRVETHPISEEDEDYSEAEQASDEGLESEEHDDELASQDSEPRSADSIDDMEQDAADTAKSRVESRTDAPMASDDEVESNAENLEDEEAATGHYAYDDEPEDYEEDMSEEGDLEEVDEDEDGLHEEDMYDDEDAEGYDDQMESESDQEQVRNEAPPMKRNSPEIIVLDSDSEDEPAPPPPEPVDHSRPTAAQPWTSERSASSADEESDSEVIDEDAEAVYDEDEDQDIIDAVDYEDDYAEGDVVSEADDWSDPDEIIGRGSEASHEQQAGEQLAVREDTAEVQSESEDATVGGMVDERAKNDEQHREESVAEESIEPPQTETGEPEAERRQASEAEVVQREETYDQGRVAEQADQAVQLHNLDQEAESAPVQDYDVHMDEHEGSPPSGIQEIQATTRIHGPGYETLEYFSSSAPNFEHIDHSTGPLSHAAEFPIDPALLESAHFSAEFTTAELQHSPVESVAPTGDEEAALADQPPADAGLKLDGASESVPVSTDLSRPSPEFQLGHQLITPEPPSQLLSADKLPAMTTTADEEKLPTPEPTQVDADMQEVESEDFVSVGEGSEAESYASAPSHRESEPGEGGHVGEDTDHPATHSEDEVMLVRGDTPRILAMNRNYPGLRSKLSYFAPLATLVDHFRGLVDTISTVADLRPVIRASSGRKDYILTLGLTDPSLAGTVLYAQIFRPNKTALPTVTEGDAILLRDFQVKSFNHAMMLASVDTSAWVVFSATAAEAQIAGPPVEYGAEEQTYATDLRQWFQETGMAMVADHQLQTSIERESRGTTPPSDAGSVHSEATGDGEPREASGSVSTAANNPRGGSSRRRKSHRRITIHELRDGRRYAEVGSPTSRDSIHELRDGTVGQR